MLVGRRFEQLAHDVTYTDPWAAENTDLHVAPTGEIGATRAGGTGGRRGAEGEGTGAEVHSHVSDDGQAAVGPTPEQSAVAILEGKVTNTWERSPAGAAGGCGTPAQSAVVEVQATRSL